ncbi:MAG: DoxX family protein [Alphaproteobacteria bacterium]
MTSNTEDTKLIVPAVGGFYEAGKPWAYPLIRVAAGLWMVPHGAQKLFGSFGGNIEGTAGFFAKIGIEPALTMAYLTGGIEFFGGILIAIGLLTRPAALGGLILMLVAVFAVHIGNGFFWNKGGYEYPLMWAVLMLAIFLKGGGELSIDKQLGKEF